MPESLRLTNTFPFSPNRKARPAHLDLRTSPALCSYVTRSQCRILYSIAVILALPVTYSVSFLILEHRLRMDDDAALLTSGFLAAGIVTVLWALIWNTERRWTNARVLWSFALWLMAVIPGGLAYVLVVTIYRYGNEGAIVIAQFAWLATYIAGSAWLWRDKTPWTATADPNVVRDRLLCPRCRYNLTGLECARCPECGTQYTLDQIVASTMESLGLDHD